jgi:hypothetical protein
MLNHYVIDFCYSQVQVHDPNSSIQFRRIWYVFLHSLRVLCRFEVFLWPLLHLKATITMNLLMLFPANIISYITLTTGVILSLRLSIIETYSWFNIKLDIFDDKSSNFYIANERKRLGVVWWKWLALLGSSRRYTLDFNAFYVQLSITYTPNHCS